RKEIVQAVSHHECADARTHRILPAPGPHTSRDCQKQNAACDGSAMREELKTSAVPAVCWSQPTEDVEDGEADSVPEQRRILPSPVAQIPPVGVANCLCNVRSRNRRPEIPCGER